MVYQGTELELFADAVTWKRYCRGFVSAFLKGSVLEVGAGLGGSTAILCDGTQDAWLCLEPDARFVDAIRQKSLHGQVASICQAVQGSVENLDTGDLFDAVLYMDVIEHIEDDRGELERAARHLRPHGSLIVLAPAGPWLYNSFDRSIGHFRRYTKRSLRAAVPSSMREVSVRYLDSVGLFASLANKVLLRKSIPGRSLVQVWDRCLVSLSKMIDPCLGYSVGKSILGIWEKA